MLILQVTLRMKVACMRFERHLLIWHFCIQYIYHIESIFVKSEAIWSEYIMVEMRITPQFVK